MVVLVELALPVEAGRAVVGQHLAGDTRVDRLGEARARRPGRGGRSPTTAGRHARIGEAAGDAIVDAGAGLQRKKPSGVRSPVRNARSRSSTSEVISCALSASVRATSTVGTPQTSAARRAAFRLRMCAWVGISTLPPRWPHFFSEASWSSKWTPAAPASISAFIISKAFSGPPKPASASATIGANQSRLVAAFGSARSGRRGAGCC